MTRNRHICQHEWIISYGVMGHCALNVGHAGEHTAAYGQRPAPWPKPADYQAGTYVTSQTMTTNPPVVPTVLRWRVGNHYGIHVYEGDRPVATFHRRVDAEIAVATVNEAKR